MKNTFKNTFKRSAAALAVATVLASAPSAMADALTGGIIGKAVAGKTITIKNKNTGLSRTVTANSNGTFKFPQLPTGRYEVSNASDSFDVTVTIGGNASVDFVNAVERISVSGSQTNLIDVSSTESSIVFTAEQLDSLPISRDVTSVAMLAPGTVKGDSGFGNLASFGGSSVAENGYYINGFDVTNIRNFTSFASVPFEAIGQQQVKTGGYGAEYGRSLGGVVNIVTKRGSNEWQFGGSAYYEPSTLREHGKAVVSQDPDKDYRTQYYAYRSEENTLTDLKYNLYASGPLIEDKLFFFGIYEGKDFEREDYYTTTSRKYTSDSPKGLLKLDYYLTDDHIFEYTYILTENEGRNIAYENPRGDEYAYNETHYTDEHGSETSDITTTTGGDVHILNYTGYITEDLSVSALVGRMESTLGSRSPGVLEGAECPLVYDRRETPTSSQRIGCWNPSQSYVPEAGIEDDKDTRESVRLGLEYSIGDHNIKFGIDNELFTSTKRGRTLTGGQYWRWHMGTGNTVNGQVVPDGQVYVRNLLINNGSASFEVENNAIYLEDSWQVNDEWLVYAGIRSEGFVNKNADGINFVESKNNIAPRLGFSWDINGDGDKKLFASAGRYYIPVASNTNIRAAGIEYTLEQYFLADSANEDPTTGAPTQVGAMIGSPNLNGSETAADPRTIAATNLKPMHQDEFIIGYEQQFEEWNFGVKYVNRKVKDGMDDYCSHQPFINWAEDNGYNDFDYHTMAGCMMMNPGRDFSIAMDLQNDGNFTEVTVPADYFGLDTYQRKYQALEFSFEKAFADDWYVKGSYTMAKSRGNVEGYVNSTNEQEDAGLTQDLDNALFQHGAYGPLPNDRKHSFKVFGVYNFNEEWSASANFTLSSGRPVSCQGFAPLDEYKDELGVDYGSLANYGSSSYYCNGVLTNRGDQGRTPWTRMLDVGFGYKPQWAEGLTVRLNIENVFNLQGITEYEETAEIGSATDNSANPNYKVPLNFQAPRSVSLSARYNF